MGSECKTDESHDATESPGTIKWTLTDDELRSNRFLRRFMVLCYARRLSLNPRHPSLLGNAVDVNYWDDLISFKGEINALSTELC